MSRFHHLRKQNFVCFRCRTASRAGDATVVLTNGTVLTETCPKCLRDMTPIGERLRVPPRRADRKWKRLERTVRGPGSWGMHKPVVGVLRRGNGRYVRLFIDGEWRMVRRLSGRGGNLYVFRAKANRRLDKHDHFGS